MSDYKHSMTPIAALQWVRIGTGTCGPNRFPSEAGAGQRASVR
jgi:hypothetical protein